VAAGLLRVQVETGVEEFVPRDDPYVRTTSEVAERFGGDPIVVLLESAKPHDLLSKEQLPTLLRLEGELASLPDVAAVYGPGTVLNQIAGQAQDLLAELAGYRDGLRSRAEAAARTSGAAAADVATAGKRATRDFDERYAALLGQGMPGGLPTLHNQAFVDRVIFNDAGDPRPRWDFLVPRSDAVAILVRPEASLRQSETERLVAAVDATVSDSDLAVEDATVTGIPAVVAALGEQIRREIPLLGGIAVLAVGAWFLLTGWTRRRYRLLPLAASLLGTACTLALAGWLGHSLALTAVAFLPVLLGIGSDFMTYLHRGVGTRTVLAAALASAAGFCALAVAPVPAVADLGVSLAVGLVITVTASLALQRWLPAEADPAGFASGPPLATRPAVSRRIRVGLVGAVLLAATAGWALLPTLSMQSDFRSLASNLDEYDDAQRIERVMGASGEVVVALRGDDVLTGETIGWMDAARREIITRHGDSLKPVISPPEVLDFLGARPTDAQVAAALRLLPSYLSASVVTPERDMAVMTYGVDLDDVGRLGELRDYLGAVAAGAPGSVDVELAGLPMVAVSAHQALQQDRLLTAVLGVLAAGAILLLLLPRRSVALLAMVSAAAASGLVMLGMVVTGLALTPMTAGLGSLTAAVACEFTVVLAHAHRVGDRRIRRAVDLAAAASATGYSVLALSDLGLIRGFGLLLALTVVVALGVSRLLVWAVVDHPRDTERDTRDEKSVARAEEPRTLEVVG
jgi:predicted RND superfamily exporter protein